MREESLEAYIQTKLKELEQQKDMQSISYKNKFSFGMDAATYSHLPAWNDLMKQKKHLVRWFWLSVYKMAFILILTVSIAGNYFGKHNGEKIAFWVLVIAAMVILFNTLFYNFTLFVKFRLTEREVRKLIYQDILFQLKQEEKVLV